MEQPLFLDAASLSATTHSRWLRDEQNANHGFLNEVENCKITSQKLQFEKRQRTLKIKVKSDQRISRKLKFMKPGLQATSVLAVCAFACRSILAASGETRSIRILIELFASETFSI